MGINMNSEFDNQKKEVICRICGNKDVKIDYTIKYASPIGFSCNYYVQKFYCCKKCGYFGVFNPLNSAEYTENYKSLAKYEGNISKTSVTEKFAEKKDYIIDANFQRSFLNQYIPEINSVLDIGASTGYALSLYDIEKKLGIEPSLKNAEIAKKYYKVNLFSGTYEQFHEQNPESKFDLIIMSHVLEHLEDPKFCIQTLKNHVNKYVYIEVPTIDLKFANRPYGLFSEEHISYFSLESLSYLMIGYDLVSACVNINPEFDIAVGFPSICTLWRIGGEQKIRKMIFSSNDIIKQYMYKSRIELKKIKKLLGNYSKAKSVSIWGAGSHTYKLLADNKIFNKINWKNIYDNNPQKWGNKIRGIPIKRYENETDDYILISSNYVQDEIYQYLISIGINDNRIIKLYQ